MSSPLRRAADLALRAADAGAAVQVLLRERLVELHRPDRALLSARETVRIGPVAAAVRLGARRHPDAVALVDGPGPDDAVTYARLDADAAALAHGLLGLGGGDEVQPDERRRPPVVGVLCRDHRGTVTALAAAGQAGFRVVLLNTGSAAPQLAQVVAREGVEVLVHDAALADRVTAVPGTVRRVLADTAGAPDAPDATAPGTVTLDDLVAAAPPGRVPTPARSGGLVVLTSGTTGLPKGAPRPKVTPLQSAQVLDLLPFPRGGTVVMAAPVFHGTGLSQLTLALASGCRVVLVRRFDAAAVVDLVARTRAQALVLVPTMLHRMLALPRDRADLARDLGSLDRIYAAGSALPPELCVRTRDLLGDVLHNMYGSTEVGVAAVASPADLALAPGCVGRTPAGARARILGRDRRPVARGERGTLFVRSALAFGGYTDGSGKEVVDGYVSTGDLAHRDEHGLLHVDGREDDMIVSGGENVVPGQVEALLAEHAAVDEVVVVGVPDEEFGQRLRAVVVPADDVAAARASGLADELRGLARDRLARHEVPREVWFVATLPRNATGKVLRRVLVAADDPDRLG